MIQHIFFDLDRTLWDFETNSHQCLLELCNFYNLKEKGVEHYEDFIKNYKIHNERLWDLYRKDQILQKDLRRERFQKALADFGIDDAILADKIGSDYVEFCPKKNKLFPFSIEVLEYLSSKYHLHIITNGFHKTQHIKLKHSNLRKYFKEVVTSEQIGAKKPNPKIFEYALSMAKAKAEESIYIGDDLVVDILGSQNCNIDGVYFNPDKIKHQENPKFEISCLSQLMEIF